MSLKLVSLNIEGKKHFARFLPFLKHQNPDIVCLQEVYVADIPRLEKELNLQSVFIPLWYLSEQENYQSGSYKKEVWGMTIFSRLPLNQTQHQYYFGQADPLFAYTGPGTSCRALLWTTVAKNNQSFTVATTHFTWTPSGQPTSQQKKHLQKLLNILKTIPDFVLCGDFNSPRGKTTFDALASLYQDNLPRNIASTIDPRLHQAGPLKLVVDGLFSTPPYLVKNVSVKCGLSDHCAIIADIDKL